MGDLDVLAAGVADHALGMVQTPDGRVRVEDYLTTLAAATGEAALAAAGFDVEGHQLTPGSAVFYEPVNAVLTGDPLPQAGPPPGSVWAILARAGIALPRPDELYVHVASSVGGVEWGAVAVTVPADNRPSVLPLRQAFEMRGAVRAVESRERAEVRFRHVLVAAALVHALGQTRSAIDPLIGARLACEVCFGTAKMAPMTEAALRAAER